MMNKYARAKWFRWVYDNWNVTHHFAVDGAMYARQGAAFPVDLLVLNGRGKTPDNLRPWNRPIQIIRDYIKLEGKAP
jgi:hypothetical protein